MKKITALLLTFQIFFFSCKQLTPEEKRSQYEKEASDKAKKIADPVIASELADMDILIMKAKNESLPRYERSQAIDELTSRYPMYLGNVSLYNISSIETEKRINLQKDKIKKQRLAQAAELVYKQSLRK